ncbi:MAG: hypothetical protein FWE74_06135 [Oscillospiraceae bacterium]|nr:hypothetical protein [Oscillospiraceae bacterium]
MNSQIDKSLLHVVIDNMAPNELEVVYKMFSAFINDYQDRHLSAEEYKAHAQALKDDEWYE